ncbi:MAG: uncharacterized membrane protein YkvA (DUF1232 family) [Candidatus Binatia bacterium]|jgi:uncharacterized membrane protein YkvA (DUF1232 family)
MSEIVDYLHHGATKVTPRILKGIHKNLPYLKIEFAQIDEPTYPHLVNQLEFLADVIEDFVEGADDDLPYVAVASAAFALSYAHQELDLIPDNIPELGHGDDSSLVRAVLMEHERALSDYASRHEMNWESITVKA